MWNQVSFHHQLTSANGKAVQHWGLSLGFGANKPEFEFWFYSLVALDKELNLPEFPFLTLRMKAIKPTLCFIPAMELFIFYGCVVSSFLCEGFSLVAASGGHSSSRCTGLSLSRPLLLRSTGSRRAGSVIVAHGPSCSATCGIFPDQGSNPRSLHWQADSQPLRHQGSPCHGIK